MKFILHKFSLLLFAGTLLMTGQYSLSAQSSDLPSQPEENISLKLEIEHAISRGAKWLLQNQAEDGSWSDAEHPALTALALTALMGNPQPIADSEGKIEMGYQFILDSVKPDGGIYRYTRLQNYNTSVSLMALVAANKPEYAPAIRGARNYIINLQAGPEDGDDVEPDSYGGIGYGGDILRPDMPNTAFALEALYYSQQYAADQVVSEADDLNWEAAIEFLQHCQNLPETNDSDWVTGDPKNRGGFIYKPGDSQAVDMELEDGRTALRSYGSMSYSGLLGYIYADLKPDDPRVVAVMDWLQKNFTLEENPGIGEGGLYYYLHTMSKALSLYGIDELELADGSTVDWKKELALKLFNLQQADGSWVNDNGRWWENDSVLCTAYSLIALERIYNAM